MHRIVFFSAVTYLAYNGSALSGVHILDRNKIIKMIFCRSWSRLCSSLMFGRKGSSFEKERQEDLEPLAMAFCPFAIILNRDDSHVGLFSGQRVTVREQ